MINIKILLKWLVAATLILIAIACKNEQNQLTQKIQIELDTDKSQNPDSSLIIDNNLPVTFQINGEIPKGGILANVLKENNLNDNQVYEAVNTLNSIFDLRRVQPGDKFRVMTDSTGSIYELIFFRNPIKKYLVFKDSTGKMISRIDEAKLTSQIELIEGTLESSLYNTVIETGEEPALAMLFTQIYQWDIDFFIDPRKGDKIRILFEKYTLNGDHVRYGNILAASYQRKDQKSIAYRYTDKKGNSKYYDEEGKCFQKAFLKSPLNYSRITSKFGVRTHPITKKRSMHNGVDYAAPYGTPIEAAADGVIESACWNPGHTGNTVIIRHPNGYKTLYGHLSKFGRYKAGMKVKQHDVVGYVGSTGRSTGNHLHYTIYHHNNPIDPLKLKNVAGPPVSKSEMPIFKQHAENLKTRLLADLEPEIATQDDFIPDTTTTDISDQETDQTFPVEQAPTSCNCRLHYIIIILLSAIIVILLAALLHCRQKKDKNQTI